MSRSTTDRSAETKLSTGDLRDPPTESADDTRQARRSGKRSTMPALIAIGVSLGLGPALLTIPSPGVAFAGLSSNSEKKTGVGESVVAGNKRLAAIAHEVEQLEALYAAGEAPIDRVLKAHLELFKAELVTVDSPGKRISAHRKRVARSKRLSLVEETMLRTGKDTGRRQPPAAEAEYWKALDQLDGVLAAQAHTWRVLSPKRLELKNGERARVLKDSSVLFESPGPKGSVSRVVFNVGPQPITHLRFEALNHESLPGSGPGRSDDGSFLLFALELYHLTPAHPKSGTYVEIENQWTDHQDPDQPIDAATDFISDTCWVAPTSDHPHAPVTAVLELDEPLLLGPQDLLAVMIDAGYRDHRTPGRVRISVASSTCQARADAPDDEDAADQGKSTEGKHPVVDVGNEREVDNAQWGHLKGRFVLEGKIPTLPRLPVGRDQDHFGESVTDDSLSVDRKSKGIGNVVVFLLRKPDRIYPDEKDPAESTQTLTYSKGHIRPRIQTLRVGQPLLIKNDDDAVVHNAHIRTQISGGHNVLIPPGKSFRITLDRREPLPIRVHDNIHPWERAWLVVSDHPYAAITDKNGTFELRHLPAGELEFRCWHERPGFLAARPEWKRGRFKVTIPQGDTHDLGTIRIPPELLKESK